MKKGSDHPITCDCEECHEWHGLIDKEGLWNNFDVPLDVFKELGITKHEDLGKNLDEDLVDKVYRGNDYKIIKIRARKALTGIERFENVKKETAKWLEKLE